MVFDYMNTQNYYAASDLGNDTVKIKINNEDFAVPSLIGPASNNEKISFISQYEQDDYMRNFFDHLEASVTSNSVKTNGHFLVGQSAINNHVTPRRFDINNFSGKSQDDLSLILNLVLLAAKRVKDAYFAKEDLSQLKMNVYLTTALPIREGKQPGIIKHYRDKYLQNDHLVTFNGLKNPISVNIHFEKVLVRLEGQTAQLVLTNSAKIYPDLAQSMLKDLKQHYNLPNATIDNIANVNNIMGIDIGGKTVDLPVFINGKANMDVSDSSLRGYDNVLQAAISDLQNHQRNFDSIGQLESYLDQGPSPFDPSSYQQVQDIVKNNSQDLVQSIIDSVSKIMGQASLNPNLVFVYGGGSIPLNRDTNLRQRLNDKLSSFNANRAIPIIWVDAKYAQKLNKLGLELLLDVLKK